MKHQSINLIRRVSSRRGSAAGATISQPVSSAQTIPAPIMMGRRPPPGANRGHATAQPVVDAESESAKDVTSTQPAHRNNKAGLEYPTVGIQRAPTQVAQPTTPIMDTLNGAMRPSFLRRRSVTPRRQVVTAATDRELAISEDNELIELSLVSARVKKPNAIEIEKEDVRSRLRELGTFDLAGLGFSPVGAVLGHIIAKGSRQSYAIPLRIVMHSGMMAYGYH